MVNRLAPPGSNSRSSSPTKPAGSGLRKSSSINSLPNRPTTPNTNHVKSRPTTPGNVNTRIKQVGPSPQIRAMLESRRKIAPSTRNLGDDLFLQGFSTSREAHAAVFGLAPPPSKDAGERMGMKSISALVEDAKRTGRLNVSSRELTAIPPAALDNLVPLSSQFHSSNYEEPTLRVTKYEYDIDVNEGQESWVQQVDLKIFMLSNNEFEGVIEDRVGGFEDLEVLDFHNNRITGLPDSFIALKHLTSLNLSSNNITDFPPSLLGLNSLKELNLSSNGLTNLWTNEWRAQLDTVRNSLLFVKSPSSTPNSKIKQDRSTFTGYWSTPSKGASSLPPPSPNSQESSPPFPSLITLNISENNFNSTTFIGQPLLPLRLKTLDLSNNGLRSNQILLLLFGKLEKLEIFDLSGNPIDEHLFDLPQDVPETCFPSLKTLNLSKTNLNSLGDLEQYAFNVVKTQVNWVGLPRIINNLCANGRDREPTFDRAMVEVKLIETPLRLEQVRRRAAMNIPKDEYSLPPSPTKSFESKFNQLSLNPSDTVSLPTPSPSPSPTTKAFLTKGSPQLSRASSLKGFSITTEPDMNDPAVQYMVSHFNAAKQLLAIHNEELTTINSPQRPGMIASLIAFFMEVNKTHLQTFPLQAFRDWGWYASLKTLNLSRNRIESFDAVNVYLCELRELDLSGNRLKSTLELEGETVPLLSHISSIAPKLKTLNLSLNHLVNTSGIQELLVPSTSDREEGIYELFLCDNKISDLSELVDVSKNCNDKCPSKWKCSVLDVQNNEIKSLPCELGYMPHSVKLYVNGNTFRFPRHNIYENSPKELLEWLRDRCD